MEVHDKRERNHEPHHMHVFSGQPPRFEERLDDVRQGWFGHRAQTQGAHGDPKLRPGEHERDVLHTLQRPVGPLAGRHERLDLTAPSRDDGEFSAHKECVAQQQQHPDEQPGVVAHGRSRGAAVRAAIRWPSMTVMVRTQPATSIVSSTAPSRPRWNCTRPAMVS